MAARLFHCTVHNRGTGNVHWVDDHLDHGVWEDGPSESARSIPPGHTGQWQAESGGDIPIIGNIATGTEGWVLLRTFGSDSIGSANEVFIKVDWDVPYWHMSQAGAHATAYRYDPRSSPRSGEFDARDHRPPNISVSTSRNGGSPSVQDLPWIAVEMWPGFGGRVQWDGKIFLDVYIDGNVPPDEPVRIPGFSNAVLPKATPVPMPRSTPGLWLGEWAGDKVEASITATPDGLFDVLIRERGAKSENTIATNHIGFSRIAFVKKSFDAARTRLSQSSQALGDFRLEMHRNVGTVLEVRQAVTAHDAIFRSVVESAREEIAEFSTDTHRIGGDYLSLHGDATLEMCKLLSQGHIVGYALRYRRPSIVPTLASLSSYDELLYRKTLLH